MLKGGYLIISKDDANIYAKLQDALTNGKPVLFYENDTTCYYIDTIALSGDDIVLTKGSKTITIEADGDITETGGIQSHWYNIEFLCNDENDDNTNVYLHILTSELLTSDNLLDFLKSYINNVRYCATGYTGSNYSVCALSYSNEHFSINDSNDANQIITNIRNIKVTQIF